MKKTTEIMTEKKRKAEALNMSSLQSHMLLGSALTKATELLSEVDKVPNARLLKQALSQNPDEETIDASESVKSLQDAITKHAPAMGVSKFLDARLAMRNLLNYITFSGLLEADYKQNLHVAKWWWEKLS
jgi:hypothetical protein